MYLKIGFIGLGTMGSRMAKNLQKAGYDLVLHNRSLRSTEELVKLGASLTSSPEELARTCKVIILSLPSTSAVEEVVCGKNGLIQGILENTVVIDTSTTDPDVTIKIAQTLQSRKCQLLDAPVSGGPEGAEAGTLSIMVGGDLLSFEKCKQILEKIGEAVFHVGPSGSGQKMKLVNQSICGAYFLVVSEAFLLAERMNLTKEDLLKVISKSWGDSPVFRHFISVVNSDDYRDGAKIDLYKKDLAMVLEISKKYGVSMPLLQLVLGNYSKASALGFGDFDASYLHLLSPEAQEC